MLVATKTASENVNLQCCHILFNYDIPWNLNCLEQRMECIHSYGRHEGCLIFNFVATNTIEDRVIERSGGCGPAANGHAHICRLTSTPRLG